MRTVSSLTVRGGGLPSGQFLRLLCGVPLDKLLRILYGAPLRSVSLLTIGGPLRSIFSHTIWGPPLRSVSSFTKWGPSVQFFRLIFNFVFLNFYVLSYPWEGPHIFEFPGGGGGVKCPLLAPPPHCGRP